MKHQIGSKKHFRLTRSCYISHFLCISAVLLLYEKLNVLINKTDKELIVIFAARREIVEQYINIGK